MNAPKGSLVTFAAAPGSVATDGQGRNGLFTEVLLRHIRTPSLSIDNCLRKVRADVASETKTEQIPWSSSSLTGNFYFASADSTPTDERIGSLPRREETQKKSTILPPTVFLHSPEQKDVTVQSDSIRVRASAKSVTSESIQDIWVLLNGRRLQGEGKKINGLTADIEITVPLTQPNNKISVIASNRHTQSEPEIINVTWKRKTQEASPSADDLYKPNLYLLSIGVSKYKQSEYDLDVAHKDAIGVASVLAEQKGGLYRSIKKRLLTDRDATRNNVLDGLDWILKESTQKDLTIIFVAGHGIKDDGGNYYFLPHDGDPAKLRRTGVNWFDFQDVIERLPSKVILLVDTCHSGSVTGKRRGAGDITEALRELMNADSGVVVMTASTGKEESQERPDWGHGAFTKALIEGLTGKADHNRDNVVDIKELDFYMTYRVKDLTEGFQHTTTEIPKTMPNFPLMYH